MCLLLAPGEETGEDLRLTTAPATLAMSCGFLTELFGENSILDSAPECLNVNVNGDGNFCKETELFNLVLISGLVLG